MLDLQWNFDDAKQAWREEGFEQGIEQGISQGIKTGVESVAINMLRKHKSFEEIADSTDLPIERIQQLALSVSK